MLLMRPMMNNGLSEHVVDPRLWDGCCSWKKRSGRLWQGRPKWSNGAIRWIGLYQLCQAEFWEKCTKWCTRHLEYFHLGLNISLRVHYLIKSTYGMILSVKLEYFSILIDESTHFLSSHYNWTPNPPFSMCKIESTWCSVIYTQTEF